MPDPPKLYRTFLFASDLMPGGISFACQLPAVFESLELTTPCAGSLDWFVKLAIQRAIWSSGLRRISYRDDAAREASRNLDRFRHRYLSSSDGSSFAAAINQLLESLAQELAEDLPNDDDLAGLLAEAFGDWIACPTVYDMLEYRLPADFGERVGKAIRRFSELHPDIKHLDPLTGVLTGLGEVRIRDLLQRQVPRLSQ